MIILVCGHILGHSSAEIAALMQKMASNKSKKTVKRLWLLYCRIDIKSYRAERSPQGKSRIFLNLIKRVNIVDYENFLTRL